MKKLLGIKLTDKEFNFLICEYNKGKQLKVVGGKVVAVERVITEDQKKANRITELKDLLAGTDYQAIKFAEGQISAEDYEPIRTQRQAWRDEINELEGGANE